MGARRMHWYWPFARPEELDWARAVVRPGDELVVEVIARPGAPSHVPGDVITVVADLRDVDRDARGLRWMTSRGRTYLDRARSRATSWRDGSFDLVHLHYLNRFTDAVTRLPHPLVMSVHDVFPHVPRLGRGAERRLLRRVYGRADALVVHHQRLVDRLVNEMRVGTERVHVVPHQVFPIGRAPEPLPEGPPRVLFFGALRANKGLDTLAASLALIKDPDLRLVIAGRGDPQVERSARALAAADPRVVFEGGFVPLERKRRLFDEASLVVLPYRSFESQSGVLHDAYGHGRPVVVTDVGALGEAVREDGTGVVVPPADPASLARAIVHVSDPGVGATFATAALEVARRRSPAAVGARLREVYDVVLA